MNVRRYVPTALTLVGLSCAVGVLQGVWGWSNTATNLAALAVVVISMLVFARTALPDTPPHRGA